MATQASERYEFIDSIRGIAALCVVFEHVLGIIAKHMGPTEDAYADGVSAHFSFGTFGVVLFFIVSGFVVPFSLRGERDEGLRRFAISRFFRLYPVYWLSVLAAAVIVGSDLDPSPERLATIVHMAVVNLTMLQQFIGVPNILPLYWTLQVELIFYGFCAFVFFCRQLNRPIVIFIYALGFLAAALALAGFAADLKAQLAILLGLVMMCFGLLYRRAWFEEDAKAKSYAFWLLGLFVAGLPLIAALTAKGAGFREHWGVYTESSFAAIVAFILLTSCCKLQHRLFVWMGRISYSVYLFHPIVIFIYKSAMGTALYELPIPAHFAIVSLLTLGLCHLLFKYVEAPCIAFGKKLIRSRTLPTAQDTPVSTATALPPDPVQRKAAS